MNSAEGSAALAQRLSDLREGGGWPGRHITQAELAEAFGISVPSISSWENQAAVPPRRRLEAYATFFATERSVAEIPYRLIGYDQLTPEELTRRGALLRELVGLRDNVQTGASAATTTTPFTGSPWQFTADQNITIVGSELPVRLKAKLPNADPGDPDFVDLYKYADLDAMLELHGHVRAANPNSDVYVRTPAELEPDHYTSHLILLGGVDWNFVTKDLLDRVELPVRQLARPDVDNPGGFEVGEGERVKLFAPKVRKVGDRVTLLEDVALFYRAPNPFNEKRTVTICNGMFGRGTYGVVRALTDARFRDRNAKYLGDRFSGVNQFSIISSVQIVAGRVLTPDWTKPKYNLHEWPVTE
ncbi:helix-turn-helix transcriptional regulator [Actinophytocola sp.]|uniref:helix-turn-helix domain-containing protein n=1 Tax=Actinophytocola sp. TaxID=1872138 RepID=UPI0025C34796|nr:helix-turn-helix transcriptional regulator [Actinophytocola sp.]